MGMDPAIDVMTYISRKASRPIASAGITLVPRLTRGGEAWRVRIDPSGGDRVNHSCFSVRAARADERSDRYGYFRGRYHKHLACSPYKLMLRQLA